MVSLPHLRSPQVPLVIPPCTAGELCIFRDWIKECSSIKAEETKRVVKERTRLWTHKLKEGGTNAALRYLAAPRQSLPPALQRTDGSWACTAEDLDIEIRNI